MVKRIICCHDKAFLPFLKSVFWKRYVFHIFFRNTKYSKCTLFICIKRAKKRKSTKKILSILIKSLWIQALKKIGTWKLGTFWEHFYMAYILHKWQLLSLKSVTYWILKSVTIHIYYVFISDNYYHIKNKNCHLKKYGFFYVHFPIF